MAQNPNITKYFNENPSNKSTQFFDQITDVSQSSDEPKVSEQVKGETPDEKDSDEPLVCKIFQTVTPNKTSETDAGSFFDMIGSVETDLGKFGK